MGGSQSQEDRSQTFSTIGLPPSNLYSHPERSQSLRVARENPPTLQSSSRDRLYRRTVASRDGDDDNIMEDSDGWLRVEPPPRPPARMSHVPLPPIPSQSSQAPPLPPPRRPPPPHAHSHVSIPSEARSSRQQMPHSSHSVRRFDDQEVLDLEQLLATLQSLQLSSRPNRNTTSDDSGSGMEQGDRRRRHTQGSGGSSRSRTRLRHRHGGPLLFVRPVSLVKCPLCSKEFTQPDLDEHLPICSRKPRVQYNEDKLRQDAGECSICLDDMVTGDEIARLPCLCVYHLVCIKGWYKKSQTCPEHPDMNGV